MTSRLLSPLQVRRATAADAARLASLAAATFRETFAADNTPEDMASYMSGAFGEAIQHAELADARNLVLFAERDGETVGYALLRDGDVPDCVPPGDTIEISRLYSMASAIGSGVGSALMTTCLAEAAARHKRTIWLGVWERNARAIAFYERWGFRDVGSHTFQLGGDRQTDRVMCRGVEEAR
jgi:ribosomal protein S18 acetylase RimI-like enzyme